MSILLAKFIKRALSTLGDNVKGGIFLDGLNREPVFPYIIYQYNVSPDTSTKDGSIYSCDVTISIFSKDGDTSLELAEQVRLAMLQTKNTSTQFDILDVVFTGYRGSLDVDEYERVVEFNIKTE